MESVEERMAYVEGRLEEQGIAMNDMRDAIVRLEDRMDQRFDRLEDRMSRSFMWQVGIQITTLTAVVVALLSR
jgi:hypothetical protein